MRERRRPFVMGCENARPVICPRVALSSQHDALTSLMRHRANLHSVDDTGPRTVALKETAHGWAIRVVCKSYAREFGDRSVCFHVRDTRLRCKHKTRVPAAARMHEQEVALRGRACEHAPRREARSHRQPTEFSAAPHPPPHRSNLAQREGIGVRKRHGILGLHSGLHFPSKSADPPRAFLLVSSLSPRTDIIWLHPHYV